MAPIITYELADVSCMLCGRLCGTARRDGPGAPLSFRVAGGADWQAVRGVSGLRCFNCGGSLFLDEFEQRREFTAEAFAEEDAARPRRGRPPRPFRIPSAA
jgi:hypothetical protein